jgi:hypothetical protein
MPLATKLRDKPHLRFYAEWKDLPAWKTLDAFAKALLIEIMTAYHPHKPLIEMSGHKASKLIPCSREKAGAALIELEKKGWIKVEVVGASCEKGQKRRVSSYKLTSQSFQNQSATKEFERWQAP